MALTVASMISGGAGPGGPPRLPPVLLGLVFVITALKAGGILWHYLDLRTSSGGWKGFFAAFVALLCGLLFLAFLFPPVLS